MLLLLLLSRFSRVWLCATPKMAAHQAPRSLGFSRQEHWSRLPFPSPMHESEMWKWATQSWLLATPWTAAYQAPPSMGFSSQEHWSGVPLPSPHRSWVLAKLLAHRIRKIQFNGFCFRLLSFGILCFKAVDTRKVREWMNPNSFIPKVNWSERVVITGQLETKTSGTSW